MLNVGIKCIDSLGKRKYPVELGVHVYMIFTNNNMLDISCASCIFSGKHLKCSGTTVFNAIFTIQSKCYLWDSRVNLSQSVSQKNAQLQNFFIGKKSIIFNLSLF